MVHPADLTAKQPERLIGATGVAIALAGALVAGQFLVDNSYPLFEPAALMVLGLALGIGAAIGSLAALSRRLRSIVVFLVCLAIAVYSGLADWLLHGIFSNPLVVWLYVALLDGNALAGANPDETARIVRAVITILTLGPFIAIAVILLERLKRHGPRLLSVIFLASLLSLTVLPTTNSPLSWEHGELPDQRSPLPTFILIMLDMQVGLAGFPANMPMAQEARAGVEHTLRDFTIHGRAYSRYAHTMLSLSSALNFTAFADLPPVVNGASDPYIFSLSENHLANGLKEAGYAVAGYQSHHMNLCAEIVDHCLTYSSKLISHIRNSTLSEWQRAVALLRQFYYEVSNKHVSHYIALSAEPLLVAAGEEIGRDSRGLAVIAHLLLPHDPFLYDESCHITPPETWLWYDEGTRPHAYELYARQELCLMRMLDGFFGQLKRDGLWDDATIIVIGDHGTRLTDNEERQLRVPKIENKAALSDTDMVDIFSTLFAIKSPGLSAGIVDAPVEIQSALAYYMGERGGLVSDNLGYALVGDPDARPIGSGYIPLQLPELFRGQQAE